MVLSMTSRLEVLLSKRCIETYREQRQKLHALILQSIFMQEMEKPPGIYT